MAGAFRLNVRSNARQIAAEIDADVRAIENAKRMAINRTIEQLRTHADREVREEYNVTLKAIRKASRIVKAARSGASRAELIYSGLQRVPLMAFGARQVRRGITAQVRRSGGRKLIPHAFIATMKSGHTGVFVRAERGKGSAVFRFGEGSRRRRRGRDLPIRELTAVDLPTLFGRKAFAERQLRFADERFDKNFDDALNAVLKR